MKIKTRNNEGRQYVINMDNVSFVTYHADSVTFAFPGGEDDYIRFQKTSMPEFDWNKLLTDVFDWEIAE